MILYIDPGTGSMLFTVLIGIVMALYFVLKKALVRIKFFFSGGKAGKSGNNISFLIFSDDKRYWNVFKPICDEMENRQIEAEYWTASEDDPALMAGYKYIKCIYTGKKNKTYAKLNYAKADICLSTTPGLDVYQWKRAKDIKWYAHIYHSMDEGMTYRMFGLDYYDAVLLNAEFQEHYIRILEQKRGITAKETVVTGSVYMDALYDKKKSLESAKNPVKDQTDIRILLAPSWGESSILARFGDKIIDALINTGYKITVRPHPQSLVSEKELINKLMEKYPENDRFKWNFDNDNFDVLNCSDVMISDFSSVIYDYSLIFDRPVIYADTDFNRDPYDWAWIDEPLWKDSILPRLGIELKEKDIVNLHEIINHLKDSEEFKEGRRSVRNDIWQMKGKAAGNVVDYIVNKQKVLLLSDKQEEV